eukprot:NODE_2164_length_973_cov_61.188312_g1777_i0.p4 GENE.NODE_2164_length_973_cov_61.188312_g1777_i0~~NODE_2164_length_973_cov_61.188312_g1777_i0.p4  ORF type:complete len:62 (+),score=8.73 NODE_2164_length_973_cov_61.188312_g1777_i0:563-748(+)
MGSTISWSSISVFQYAFTVLRINQFDGQIFKDGGTGLEYLKLVNCDPAENPIWRQFVYLGI